MPRSSYQNVCFGAFIFTLLGLCALHGLQPPEEHITDGPILKPFRLDFRNLIQPHGTDGFLPGVEHVAQDDQLVWLRIGEIPRLAQRLMKFSITTVY